MRTWKKKKKSAYSTNNLDESESRAHSDVHVTLSVCFVVVGVVRNEVEWTIRELFLFLERAPVVCGWMEIIFVASHNVRMLKIKVLSLSQHDPSLVFEKRSSEEKTTSETHLLSARTHVNLWIYIFLVFFLLAVFFISLLYNFCWLAVESRLLCVCRWFRFFSSSSCTLRSCFVVSSSSTALAAEQKKPQNSNFPFFYDLSEYEWMKFRRELGTAIWLTFCCVCWYLKSERRRSNENLRFLLLLFPWRDPFWLCAPQNHHHNLPLNLPPLSLIHPNRTKLKQGEEIRSVSPSRLQQLEESRVEKKWKESRVEQQRKEESSK